MPSTPRDARGLLKSAVREPNPVIFIEHKVLYNEKGEVPEEEELIPIGKAQVKRPGKDITITSHSRQALFSLAAAEKLYQDDGIDVEVIDLMTLSPLDEETIFNSVKMTKRLLTVEEGYQNCGVGAEVISRVTAKVFDYLDAAPARLAFPNCPVPFSKVLESAILPDTDKICRSVKQILCRRKMI